jgi:pyruvate dehydrogenase E1 component alpha subunit
LPENPLLPNRKLRELHALIERCRDLEKRNPARARAGAREALLAATAIQLLPGDVLLAEPGDRAAAALAPLPKSSAAPAAATPSIPRIPLAAAMAAGLQAAATAEGANAGLVLALARAAAAEPGWSAALEWAHAAQLPLLLCCADATGGKLPRAGASKQDPALTWTNLSRFAKKLRLPVFAVDGEDAVAVYRVMQESVIRARDGGGPAVLWAVLSPQPPTGLQRPLARLRSYLESRRISLRR